MKLSSKPFNTQERIFSGFVADIHSLDLALLYACHYKGKIKYFNLYLILLQRVLCLNQNFSNKQIYTVVPVFTAYPATQQVMSYRQYAKTLLVITVFTTVTALTDHES